MNDNKPSVHCIDLGLGWPALGVALVGAALAACTGAPVTETPPSPAPVPKIPVSAADGKWELVNSSFIGAGRIPGVPRATLAFGNGGLSAFGGCNHAHGTAFHVEGRLEVAGLKSTRRACPEPLGSFEARFFKLLQAHPVYRVEANTLTLLDGQHNARFRRADAAGAPPAGP